MKNKLVVVIGCDRKEFNEFVKTNKDTNFTYIHGDSTYLCGYSFVKCIDLCRKYASNDLRNEIQTRIKP